jgi:polyferredoxin
MKWLQLLALFLLFLCGQSMATESESPAPPCFKIPSAEELGSDDTIANYREQYIPKLNIPESNIWPIADAAMLAAVLLLGCVMVWRHIQTKWFWIPGLITLLYFGFIRGGCICPVGSVANVAIGLKHPEMIGKSTAIMFLLPLLVAFIMGRVFCVAGCPIGAIQHLLAGNRFVRLPVTIERITRALPVIALISTAWLAVRGSCLLVCILDPYKTAFFFGYGWIHRLINVFQGGFVELRWFWVGDITAWVILIAAVLLGLRIYRPFCRFVCPYGVLLGLLSMVSLKRRHIDQNPCLQCGICEKKCPVNAIVRDPKTREFSISAYHCIQCNNCSSHCRKDGIR